MTSKSLVALLAVLCAVAFGCGGTGSAPQGNIEPKVQGTAQFQPAYYVLSLEYAPPGDLSGNTFYAQATTYGAIADLGSAFTGSPKLQFQNAVSPQGAAPLLGPSFSLSTVPGFSQSFQGTYTNLAANGSSWSLTGAVTSVTDQVDHTQDVFFLWLNPAVSVSQTGSNIGRFQISTPVQPGGAAEPMDVVWVSVAELLNPGLIPPSKLGPQTVNNVTGLPGLSSLCADPSQCIASDFAPIVSLDPLVSVAATNDPSTVDPSRFVYVGNAIFMGPGCVGCSSAVNAYWFTDSGISANSESIAYTVPLRTTPQVFGSFSFSSVNPGFTWRYTTSAGNAAGLHQSQAILQSSTIHCYENVGMFEDTLFHTFLFQQPPPIGSC